MPFRAHTVFEAAPTRLFGSPSNTAERTCTSARHLMRVWSYFRTAANKPTLRIALRFRPYQGRALLLSYAGKIDQGERTRTSGLWSPRPALY